MRKYILVMFLLLPLLATADDSGACGDGVAYTYADATHTLTISGSGDMYRFHVVGGWSVYDRDTPWKAYQEQITTVVIEQGVTSIGEGAFWGCANLEKVTIPSSVTAIKASAFAYCDKMTAVHISDLASWCGVSFELYNESPLYYAHHLYLNGEEIHKLVIPEGVKSISMGTFLGCSDITSVTFPDGLENIGHYAFEGCSELTKVIVPNSVTSIGDGAFRNCEALVSATLPTGLTHIANSMFEGCESLFSITIPTSVTSIGDAAFMGCKGLSAVTLPAGLTSIGISCFRGCNSLTSVNLPQGLTAINIQTFYECYNLKSVNIPQSVETIGERAFYGCGQLSAVHITDIASWCKISFNESYGNPLQYAGHLFLNGEEVQDLVIPDGVTAISSDAFCNCLGLNTVKIPQSVTSIGERAFYRCWNMTAVELPDGIDKLKKNTFQSCQSLKTITIPESVEYIYAQVFDGCNSLESVTVKAVVPPFLNPTAFTDYAVPLYVPSESVEDYRTDAQWSSFTSILTLSGDNPDRKKCAAPTYTYADGKLYLNCETEGAHIVTKITTSDADTYQDNEISLSGTYTVTMYATLEGYDDSDKVTFTLNWKQGGGVQGDVNGDGKVGIADIVTITNIMAGQQ